MKNDRHSAIIKMISENAVETQGELAQRLTDMGYRVTQATVSRDIKELKLVKTRRGDKYCYSIGGADATKMALSKYRGIISDSIISIAPAMNLAVIKCHVGMANAACVALEHVISDTGVGMIAGDDTIFVAFADIESTDAFVREVEACL